jgi:hypothetical protein
MSKEESCPDPYTAAFFTCVMPWKGVVTTNKAPLRDSSEKLTVFCFENK